MTATAQPAILASSYIAFEALQQETGSSPLLAGTAWVNLQRLPAQAVSRSMKLSAL